MSQHIIDFLKQFIDNEYALLFVISMLPMLETRAALILASTMDVNLFYAYLVCVLGSNVVSPLLMTIFTPVMNALKKIRFLRPLAQKAEEIVARKAIALARKADARQSKQILIVNNKKIINARYRQLAESSLYKVLFWFSSLPLPLTGVWSGTAVAAFLRLKWGKTVITVSLGNMIATAVVALLMHFFGEFADLILAVFFAVTLFSLLLALLRGIYKKPSHSTVSV